MRRVGCDFCLQVDDLVAPLLSQSAENSGLGTMIEQILSEESSTQSLFVRKLKIDWVPKNWLETISEVKRQCNHLAVGLIRHRESRLLVNPHPETMVYSGDKLIFIALESEENRQILFEPNHILSIADEPFLKEKKKSPNRSPLMNRQTNCSRRQCISPENQRKRWPFTGCSTRRPSRAMHRPNTTWES